MNRPRNPPAPTATETAPLADRPSPTDAERGRARERGLNTDSRGGLGSAKEADPRQATQPARGAGLYDDESSEPREDTRLPTQAPSQGLAGAQGSGGGARRGTKPPSGGRAR